MADRFDDKDFVLGLAKSHRWHGKDGPVDMASMDSRHIRNCISILERKDNPACAVLIAAFEEELSKRSTRNSVTDRDGRYRMLCGVVRDLMASARVHDPVTALRCQQILDRIGVDSGVML